MHHVIHEFAASIFFLYNMQTFYKTSDEPAHIIDHDIKLHTHVSI